MSFLQNLPTILIQASKLAKAMEEDEKRGTTRNTTEAVVGAFGAMAGAVSAQDIEERSRSKRDPDFYSVVKSAMEVTAAAMATDEFVKRSAGSAFDSYEYDVKEIRCNSCGDYYKCRLYTEQSRTHCESCLLNRKSITY